MANDAVWNRFISELLDKNDIVDVISSYIDVKPKGRGFWALCPFHNDRNPSLSINREGQYFHCFVCGVGGNAIRFIMKYESCSFMEAVETLAKRAGLEVPDRSGGDDAAYERKKKGKTDSLRRLPRSRAFLPCLSYVGKRTCRKKISRKQGNRFVRRQAFRHGLLARLGFA